MTICETINASIAVLYVAVVENHIKDLKLIQEWEGLNIVNNLKLGTINENENVTALKDKKVLI